VANWRTRELETRDLEAGYEPTITIPAWAVSLLAVGLLAGVYLLLAVLR
jgi:hypothetical protein